MKENIIRKSIELFDEKGFIETSIQDIVGNIGVTKGTFYYYFNSKQELLRDIHLSYLQELLGEQQIILEDKDKNYIDKLYGIIYLLIKKIKSHGPNARILFREMRHLNQSNMDQIKKKRKEFRNNFQLMIEEGVQVGEFNNNVRSDILTIGILSIANRSYYWYNSDGEIGEKELVDLYLELILNGIKA
ncbi:TetR/AcrR family transcriptional regulator [Oceanobacillus halophilus]|uniref:TetR/AcrR family transcriptional regulator n=1 Tax=Oceanobacillus halophilus TaxID=930130 RepID=A0A495A8S4_9BACI|nr:TetR/AcrR family transcriptional regulator [Oceanobacillus halophilus]RKQ35741.1 TetR/AcrR family transcriptional regulator [Oceanobacillus halophilus]